MTIDAATISQAITTLGVSGLLGLFAWLIWRRLVAREDRMDRLVDVHSARQERVIAYLTGAKPPATGEPARPPADSGEGSHDVDRAA